MSEKHESETNTRKWWLAFSIICLLTICTRFYKVHEPDHVCWDETHFGKMGSWYINRTFFFDVHPPLGKMLIGLSGYLTGYDGKFAFDKPGDKYENTSYLGMRLFCTALGASIVPMTFITVEEMTYSVNAAIYSSLLILFDVGLITLTQYILLDPILLCFMMGSVTGAVKVSSNRIPEFSVKWWLWLLFTGTMLACCISVKFVGLFVVFLVGFMTIADLWNILGDLTRPVMDIVKHLIARAACLIILPICLYMTFFYIHLTVLNRSGNGDGFYSSAFQSQLIGNSLHNASMPQYVAYGAVITLKNHRTGGGYLHSHFHLYPEGVGARQQQITTYTHKDDNNKWIIKKYNEEPNTDKVEIVKNGDLVRFEHVPTRRNLHSHKEQAPITKKHYQVTGYGENGTGDANDVWRLSIISSAEGSELQAVRHKIKLVHYLQQCLLTTSGKQLPKWGYEQQEVSCNPNLRDVNGLWNVEENYFEKLPNVSFEVYAPSFLERFLESHAVMFQGNAGLKPKEGEITSRPWQWPINYRGQFFSGSQYRIYLLGNPVIWWANLVFILIFLVCFITNCIKIQRGHAESFSDGLKRKLVAGGWLFFGWVLHYVPFWAMGRVLYFHHYFPALLFSSMITGVNKYFQMAFICDKFCDNLNKDVASEKIWAHLETMYNLEALDESESIPFPNGEKEFRLPDADFGNLINKKEIEEKNKAVTTPKGGRETPKPTKETKKEEKPTPVKNQKEKDKEKERRDSKEITTKDTPKTTPIAKKEMKKEVEKSVKEKAKPGRPPSSATNKEESKSGKTKSEDTPKVAKRPTRGSLSLSKPNDDSGSSGKSSPVNVTPAVKRRRQMI